MNKKMTRLALAAKCGRFAASGSAASPERLSAAGSDSSAKRAASASAPNPPPVRRKSSRRFMLIDIDKLVRAQQQMTIATPRVRPGSIGVIGEKSQSDFGFGRSWKTAQRDLVQSTDPLPRRALRNLTGDPRSQVGGQVNHQSIIEQKQRLRSDDRFVPPFDDSAAIGRVK